MSEPRVSELTKALGVLSERLDGLRQAMEARFDAVEQRFRSVDLRIDDAPALRPPPGRVQHGCG